MPPPALLLREKLIRLELDIKDKNTSIDLVNEALQEEENAHRIVHTDLTNRYNANLEANAAKTRSEGEELLQQVHRALAVKKGLADKTQSLIDEKRQQEVDATNVIGVIRNDNQKAISDAHTSFRTGEVSRTDSFLAQEANTIKKRTIKALEPEVRRILELHRCALEALIKAEEEETNEMTATLNSIYQQKIESFHQDAKQDHDRHVAEIQERYNERSSVLYDDHTMVMSQLRNQISLSKEAGRNQQNERLRQLSERHSSELLTARSEVEGRLATLRRQHELEIDAFKTKSKEELRAIANDSDQRKAEIEIDIRSRMEQERSDRIRDAENELMLHREAKIEGLVRNAETDLVRCERLVRDNTAKREKTARSEHLHELERIRGETRQHQQHLASVSEDNRQLQSRKISLEMELKSLQDTLDENQQVCKNIESKGIETETESHKIQAAFKAEMETEVKRYGDRIQRLNLEITEVTEQSRLCQIQHEGRMRATAGGHEQILDELDAKARTDLAALDERHAEIERETEDMSTRVEHLQTMLLRYTEDQKEDRKEDKKDLLEGIGKNETVDRTKKRGPARIRKVLKSISRNSKASIGG